MHDRLVNLLQKLSLAPGPPGMEDAVREIIAAELEGHVDRVEVDALGNLIAVKEGNRPVRVMLDAHMDEVALMVRSLRKDGFINFIPLGGVDPAVLLAQRVVVHGRRGPVPGVIGAKPRHVMTEEELKKRPEIKSLYIDVGATSDEELLSMGILPGSFVTFDVSFQTSGDLVIGKAFDDRIGCLVLLEVLKSLPEDAPTVYAAFTVQEEQGLRGATVAAYRIDPEVAFALEGTIAADTPGVPEGEHATKLGSGPALRVMDASMLTQRRVLEFMMNVAERVGVPYQLQLSPRSGTDAGRIHLTRKGVPTGVVSVPVRYIHTPSSVAKLSDIEATITYVRELILTIHSKDEFMPSL